MSIPFAPYDPQPAFAFSDLMLISPNRYAVKLRGQYAPDNITPVEVGIPAFFSQQPNGSVQSRANVGSWETGTLVGNFLVFDDPAYPHPFAYLVVKL